MARVKRGTKRRARRKKYLRRTKGFFLTKSKLYQSAQEAANRIHFTGGDRQSRRPAASQEEGVLICLLAPASWPAIF